MITGHELDQWADALDASNDDEGAAAMLGLLRLVHDASDLLSQIGQLVADAPGDANSYARHAGGDCGELTDIFAEVRSGFTLHLRGGGR